MTAAACLIVGWVLGHWTRPSSRAPASEGADRAFLFLLRETPQSPDSGVPEETLVSEYTDWAQEEARAGRLIGGAELEDTRRLLTNDRGTLLVDGATTAPGVEVVSGYFLLRAADYERAVQIAKGCPHLKSGGSIEVRAIK